LKSSTGLLLATSFLALLGLKKVVESAWFYGGNLWWLLWRKSQVESYKRYGNGESEQAKRSWAVVTGASQGLGAAYAISLAKRGFNLVLIARNQEQLQQVK